MTHHTKQVIIAKERQIKRDTNCKGKLIYKRNKHITFKHVTL